jgi:hypothetical protein
MAIRILPPNLTTSPVSPVNLNFGTVSQVGGPASDSFQILNTGQSILHWVIDTSGLPNWVSSVTPTVGNTTTIADLVLVTVNPNAPGLVIGNTVNTSFTVFSNGGTATVNVSMTVGA